MNLISIFVYVCVHSSDFYQCTIHSISQLKLWEVKQIFGIINSKIKIKIYYLCLRRAYIPHNPYIKNSIYMNKIFKIVILFKKSIQNVQKKLDKNPRGKKRIVRIWIAPCIIYKFSLIQYFLKLNLFKNCIKWQEMNLQQFLEIVTNISIFFLAQQTSCE